MKRFFYATCLIVLTLLCADKSELKAQVSPPPYLSKDGLSAAEQTAKDSLASDAILVYIGTFGEFESQGYKTTFNLDNGQANIWGYVYYSPSQDKSVTVVPVKVLGTIFLTLVVPDFPLPIPSVDKSVDVSGSYANSDKLIERLKTNITYQQYRTDYSGAKPDFVSYGNSVPDNPFQLPDGFPTDEPVWTMSFLGQDDSTMTCFVSANTGTTTCLRIEKPLSVSYGSEGVAGTASLSVAPNPATGHTRVTVDVPSGVSPVGAELVLYNAMGQKVMNLTESFAGNAYRFVEFDASTLPAGVYYCRATGTKWNGTIGVVIGQ